MNNKLEQLYNALEADKQKLLQQASILSEAKLNHSKPGAWSSIQIISHLSTAELSSLNYMKKKSLGVNNLKNSGALEALKFLLLKLSQRIPFKYKAPKYVVDNTPVNSSLTEVIEQWNKTRIELKSFLEGIEERTSIRKFTSIMWLGTLMLFKAFHFYESISSTTFRN